VFNQRDMNEGCCGESWPDAVNKICFGQYLGYDLVRLPEYTPSFKGIFYLKQKFNVQIEKIVH